MLVAVLVAVMTEIRSCFLNERHTDFGVYLRAAWAAREGHDMYAVVDDHGWHYCYPPTFALFLTPIADPPAGSPRAGYPPYWFAVAVWTVLCVAFAVFTANMMANAALPDAVRGSRRWWYARTVPLTVAAGGVGFTVTHGQVNTLVGMLMGGVFVAWAAKKSFASGVWLAGAVAVKVIPGLLLLFALVQRDRRAVVGFVAGSVLLLGVVPAAFFGPAGAIRENLKMFDQVIAPGATGGGDQTRADELTGVKATDSHSFLVVIHNIRNPGHWTRTNDLAPSTRVAHWTLSFLILGLTLRVGWRNRRAGPVDQGVFLGALVLVML
ncbi:MAG TPA: glycosyltransferase family 87 protein, partial [Gemmataceae bacterium]|nr:glycosyltransferase family 87 protein [Gemmataceae bacterium]